MVWLSVFWAWVKKHALLVEGVVVLILGFIFGVSLKKRPVLVQGASPLEKKIEDKTAAEEQRAQVVHDETQQAATVAHARDTAAIVAEEERTAPKLLPDAQATNDYLKSIGQEVRGGDDGDK